MKACYRVGCAVHEACPEVMLDNLVILQSSLRPHFFVTRFKLLLKYLTVVLYM